MATTNLETPVSNSLDVDLEMRVKLYLSSQRRELGKLLVRVEAGSVRLVGPVSSFYLRQLALAIVRRVAGVRHIVDEIEVPVLTSSRRQN